MTKANTLYILRTSQEYLTHANLKTTVLDMFSLPQDLVSSSALGSLVKTREDLRTMRIVARVCFGFTLNVIGEEPVAFG